MPDIAASIKTKANFEQLANLYTFTGALEKAGDSDWIRINLNVGVTYQFWASFTESDSRDLGNAQMALFDASGNPIMTGSQFGSGPYLTYTAGADGFAYLEIHQTTTFFQSSGTYSLFAAANLGGTPVYLGSNPDERTSAATEIVAGGLQNDILKAGMTASALLGQGGNDILYGGDNAAGTILDGGHGSDTLYIGFNATNAVALGGAGDDDLFGSLNADTLDGGAGSDYLDGDLGADRLTGGLGRDVLYGSAGDDTFAFNSIAESRRGLARDLIKSFGDTDFDQDIIDLEPIDANTRKGGDHDFVLIETKAFHHKAGELHIQRRAHDLARRHQRRRGADFEIGILGHVATFDQADFDL